MKEKDNIKNRGPKRHDETCFQVQHDIIIPKGTILRAAGNGKFVAPFEANGEFSITVAPADTLPARYKRVISI